MQRKAICNLLYPLLRYLFTLILLMRTTAVFFLAGFLQVSAHSLTQEKITLSEKDAPLSKVFEDIQKQTTYYIWYDKAVIPKTATVSVELKDATLQQTLDLCLKDLPLEYSIVGKNVVIEEKGKKRNADPPNKVAVKGRVVNEKGEPGAGISVSIKGSAI